MHIAHRVIITVSTSIVLLILGALLWQSPVTEHISTPSASPIPLTALPALPGPLIQEHNLLSQVAGQIARARFSSDPTASPVTFAVPPRLRAFLYNSAPCTVVGEQTTYRLAVYGDSVHPADGIIIHVTAPQNVSLFSFSQQYEQYEPETHSYYWLVPTPLVQGEVFVVNVTGRIATIEDAKAELIVTYNGLEDDDIRHVISTSFLSAC